ncbi:MAG: hypothetical protein FWG26_03910 [Betaproteobacteria bacterium]|nr:hypothetical protein [Betaproteobacteria bacterium]
MVDLRIRPLVRDILPLGSTVQREEAAYPGWIAECRRREEVSMSNGLLRILVALGGLSGL